MRIEGGGNQDTLHIRVVDGIEIVRIGPCLGKQLDGLIEVGLEDIAHSYNFSLWKL